MKFCIKLVPLIAIFGLALMLGCESGGGGGPAVPADTQGWINQGWSYYRSDNYQDAYDAFLSALDMANADYWNAYEDYMNAVAEGDSVAADEALAIMAQQLDFTKMSLSGIGWVTIKDIEPYSGTLVFDEALGIDPDYAEALAGYAILLQTLEEWQQSSEKAASLLSVNPAWVFEQDNNIDHLDIRLLRTENYYFLAQFETSLQQANALILVLPTAMENQLASLVPGVPLDGSYSPNLATIEGRAALMELIEALAEVIG